MTKKKYHKPTLIMIPIDNEVSSEWKPGDGKPPWAGGTGGRGGRPKKSSSNDNPFGGDTFVESPFNEE